MTDIPPALTSEEWASFPASWEIHHEWGLLTNPQRIALANAALPDDSPHKITRTMVDALRELAGPRRVAGARIAVWLTRPDEYVLDPSQLHEIADVLESYLPPDASR